jgi:hypothetical protein
MCCGRHGSWVTVVRNGRSGASARRPRKHGERLGRSTSPATSDPAQGPDRIGRDISALDANQDPLRLRLGLGPDWRAGLSHGATLDGHGAGTPIRTALPQDPMPPTAHGLPPALARPPPRQRSPTLPWRLGGSIPLAPSWRPWRLGGSAPPRPQMACQIANPIRCRGARRSSGRGASKRTRAPVPG